LGKHQPLWRLEAAWRDGSAEDLSEERGNGLKRGADNMFIIIMLFVIIFVVMMMISFVACPG
jgi:hypothetical protein